MAKEKKKIVKREVSPEKIKALKELIKDIEKSNTIIISSIENLPSKQMQKIRHMLRKQITMLIVKKKAAVKALNEAKKENVSQLAQYVEKNSAIIFSNLDPFEIAGLLIKINIL